MTTPMKTIIRTIMPACVVAAMLAMAGCATQPYGYNNGGYGTTYGNAGYRSQSCVNCGMVQSVQQVYINGSGNNNHVLGTIIGAVVGGALGNQVGKGNGRNAATIAGAVAGGAVGNQVAKRNSNGSTDVGYRVVVRLDDGRTATVTQREDPRVRNGDRVQVRNNHVYLL